MTVCYLTYTWLNLLTLFLRLSGNCTLLDLHMLNLLTLFLRLSGNCMLLDLHMLNLLTLFLRLSVTVHVCYLTYTYRFYSLRF